VKPLKPLPPAFGIQDYQPRNTQQVKLLATCRWHSWTLLPLLKWMKQLTEDFEHLPNQIICSHKVQDGGPKSDHFGTVVFYTITWSRKTQNQQRPTTSEI
jgi:hypothetical protein